MSWRKVLRESARVLAQQLVIHEDGSLVVLANARPEELAPLLAAAAAAAGGCIGFEDVKTIIAEEGIVVSEDSLVKAARLAGLQRHEKMLCTPEAVLKLLKQRRRRWWRRWRS